MTQLAQLMRIKIRTLRTAVACRLSAMARKVEPRSQLSEDVCAEIRALVAQENELYARWAAVDRSLPDLPADVGNGDITSILALLEIRASSVNEDVANQAQRDLSVIRLRIAAQKQIEVAEHPIRQELSGLKSRRLKLQYGRA